MHVWHPSENPCPHGASIAIATLSGQPELIQELENSLVKERPEARSDLRLITSQQLSGSNSLFRLASTAPMKSNLTALQSARQVEANLLLEGEILNARFSEPGSGLGNGEEQLEEPQPTNEYLLISWRIVDVSSGKSIANHIVSIDTDKADRDYPDLMLTHPNATSRLIAASARESWKALAPSVAREEVELMVPWLQLGAMRTRAGIIYAKQERWDLAEQQWRVAARFNPLNVAARHNLALAQAAREDFTEAKRQLRGVRWPLSTQLPPESSHWLDQRHRQYCDAHGLGKPAEGWLFPDPAPTDSALKVEPIYIKDLPLWTAIPFTKPPGWTWEAWLRQPVVW
jgi:hypothetical protein